MVSSMAVVSTTNSGRQQQQQLNIAFVTGNAMKVREIEMILAEMGAINVEKPEESLGQSLTSQDECSRCFISLTPKIVLYDVKCQTVSNSESYNTFFSLFKPYTVKLRVVNVDLPEIQEVNTEGIAKEKALLAAQLAGGPALIEDTSLQFKSLGGMPGPYIKVRMTKMMMMTT